MTFAWVVECKTCCQRFAVKPREVAGKGKDQVLPDTKSGTFECPHCHEFHEYSADDYIPGEGRIYQS